MDKESFDKIVDAFEQADFEPRSYSGRAMYGKDCLGVVCHSPVGMMAQLFAALAENCDTDEIGEIAAALSNPSTDNMGHDAIVYWRGIPWLSDDGDDDGDDEPVEVNTEDFTGSHGHDPGGEGQWLFYLGEAGEECPDEIGGKKLFSHSGSYAQAKRAAVEAAREQGKGTVFVLS